MFKRAAVILAVAGIGALGVGLAAQPAAAPPPTPVSPILWQGNGTNNGFCGDNTAQPGGNQDWLFILTSPSGSSWTLTATFKTAGTVMVTGVQQGGGSIHFDVITTFGDQLLSASATNGSTVSVLTVSHCTPTTTPVTPPPPGPPPTTSPTTTPGGTTPTTAKPGAGRKTIVVAPAPQAVTAPARLTG